MQEEREIIERRVLLEMIGEQSLFVDDHIDLVPIIIRRKIKRILRAQRLESHVDEQELQINKNDSQEILLPLCNIDVMFVKKRSNTEAFDGTASDDKFTVYTLIEFSIIRRSKDRVDLSPILLFSSHSIEYDRQLR